MRHIVPIVLYKEKKGGYVVKYVEDFLNWAASPGSPLFVLSLFLILIGVGVIAFLFGVIEKSLRRK